MAKKANVTIYDIADALQVSSGTVYRALHNTGRISAETRRRVLEAAQQMGYTTNLAAQSLGRNPIYIGCLLCCPVAPFLVGVRRGVEAAMEALKPFRVFADIREIQDNIEEHPEQIDAIIREFQDKDYKGVVLLLSGAIDSYEGVIRRLEAEGVSVALVVADLPNSGRSVSVTVDGRCAGRLAAEMLHLACRHRRVAILTGGKVNSINELSIRGFIEYAESHPFEKIDIFEHRDISHRALDLIREILSNTYYDGMYISTASSVYLYEYQKEHPIRPDIRIVTTDLFKENRALLREEIVCATIFQDPYMQGRRAVEMLYRRICGNAEKGEYRITPQLVLHSNWNLYAPAETTENAPLKGNE